MTSHGPEFHAHDNHGNHHKKREDRVKVIRDGPDKNGKSIFAFHKAGHGRRPGRNRRDDADRRRRGVDQVGKLCPGNPEFIRNRAHDASDGQAVKIVVNKNQDAEKHRRKLRAGTALNPLRGEPSEGGRTAGLVHQADHGAEDHKEHQNPHVVAVGEDAYQPALKYVRHSHLKIKAGIEDSPHQDPQKQRAVHLLRDKRQTDRHHRRQKCPDRRVGSRHIRFCPVRRERSRAETCGKKRRSQNQPKQFLLHIFVPFFSDS